MKDMDAMKDYFVLRWQDYLVNRVRYGKGSEKTIRSKIECETIEETLNLIYPDFWQVKDAWINEASKEIRRSIWWDMMPEDERILY